MDVGQSLSLKRKRSYISRIGAICAIALTVWGATSCGSSGGAKPPVQADITIVGQPSNQSTPLGQTATFSVTARGGSPLSYQWNMNGTVIQGATSESFVTPPVSSTDAGSSFTVTVTDTSGSSTSSPATLSIGPRSPRMGDLRFKEVDFASTLGISGTGDIVGLSTSKSPTILGSPLEVGAGACGAGGAPTNCAWNIELFQLPVGTGINTTYQSDFLQNLAGDIQAVNAPNVVITSLDERPANNVFALSYIQTDLTTGFDLALHTEQPADFQTAISLEGMQGRVVTAVCVNPLQEVDYVSYGWQDDNKTYDVISIFATNSDAESQAATLAMQGYIITAVGSSGSDDGFILVGTRVHGDNLPRPFAINQDFSSGFAPVGKIFDVNGNTTLGEK